MSEQTAAAEAGSAPARAPVPPAPATIEDTGLGYEQLKQLLVKALFAGELSGLALSDKLCLPYVLLESLVEHLRVEKLVEVRGSLGSGTAGYRYALTELGRERAGIYLEANGYVGPAPVPLKQYTAAMNEVKARRGFLDKDRIAYGFTHLVVNQEALDQLGPAVNSGKSVFLYGPPGNGKTVVAEGIGRALGGDLYVPWALDIDGQIITIFDPVNHVRLEDDAPSGPSIIKAVERDLLNRWIVPLESRVDYLTLHTGKKFEMPFDVLIVFATNLNPESLADEAFLRRIPYKIYAKNPTSEEFGKIFALNCKRRGIAYDPVIVEYLERRYYEPRGLDMRACHPRDIVEQVVDICRDQARPLVITRELLDQACKNYFLEEQKGRTGSGARRPGAVMKAGRPPAERQEEKPAAKDGKGEEWLS